MSIFLLSEVYLPDVAAFISDNKLEDGLIRNELNLCNTAVLLVRFLAV